MKIQANGTIKDKLNINLCYDDSQSSGRIGLKKQLNQRNTRFSKVVPRPIIFKFVGYQNTSQSRNSLKELRETMNIVEIWETNGVDQ